LVQASLVGCPMTDAGTAEKLKVFISYSQKDSAAFAGELVAGLEVAGFAPFLDRHDIVAGEDWEARLGGLIAQSDTVLFVVSPEAVKSERCAWEVDRTIELSKRLLPIIFKSVPEHDIPEKLRRLQFVRFDGGAGFGRPLSQLAEALRVDLDWIREHTRLGELARRWGARGRPESLLLRGDDLIAAKAWVTARKVAAPEITDAQGTFIRASEQAETARIRKERGQVRLRPIAWLLAVLLGGSILGLIAWVNQGYLSEQWSWYATVQPYMFAQVRPYVLSAENESALRPGRSFRECAKHCPEMVVVPAGEFHMGSPIREKGRFENEGPQRKVVFDKAFAVSKFEVTVDQWTACVAIGGCTWHGPVSSRTGRGAGPVTFVNWDDAKQYAAWLSQMTGKPYRLLSEAEWEYAARAGSQTAYFWGNEVGKGNANCDGCGGRRDNDALQVGSFRPNAFGLHDMHGNVAEWVEDCVERTASGNCKASVVRGGSWAHNPALMRAAFRVAMPIDERTPFTGFRVGRTLIAP
jgi:formylglycine-generating enzyme required for sulfatase activity